MRVEDPNRTVERHSVDRTLATAGVMHAEIVGQDRRRRNRRRRRWWRRGLTIATLVTLIEQLGNGDDTADYYHADDPTRNTDSGGEYRADAGATARCRRHHAAHSQDDRNQEKNARRLGREPPRTGSVAQGAPLSF